MGVECQTDLPQIVRALRAPGGFARRLDGRQDQRGEQPDDGDDHQQFDQREAASAARRSRINSRERVSAHGILRSTKSRLLLVSDELLSGH
jgi:hypothetical protein